jgi:hypothetical protein
MVQGLWYEQARDRWRVKIILSGELFHRSYHHDYEEAFRTWTQVQEQIRSCRTRVLPPQARSPIAKFLRQPPPGAGVVS